MRNAYALLGLSFFIVFGGAYILLSDKAHAPAPEDEDRSENNTVAMSLSLTSTAFQDNESIPSKYTCDGENISPPLSIQNIPADAQSLVLVMDDPDIPEEVKTKMGIDKFNHYAVYNVPADTIEFPEGVLVGTAGANSRGEQAYTGPCPPREFTPTEHRYIFRLYALPTGLDFADVPTLEELEATAKSLSIEDAVLMGRYERKPEEE